MITFVCVKGYACVAPEAAPLTHLIDQPLKPFKNNVFELPPGEG